MTAWLSGWLRDIVLIILVATFVDLLIPNNSLQRYVKVVVSLIILLTILSPVISFLNEDKAINQAVEQASGKKDGSQALNLILSNGAKLKEENDRSSTLLAEQQVGKMIKEQLEKSLSLQVREVTVTILEEEGLSPTIQQIQIVLLPDDGFEDQPQSRDQVEKVNNVASVSVKVSLGDTEHEVGNAKKERSKRSTSEIELEYQVIHQLKEQWGLEENRIQVEWG